MESGAMKGLGRWALLATAGLACTPVPKGTASVATRRAAPPAAPAEAEPCPAAPRVLSTDAVAQVVVPSREEGKMGDAVVFSGQAWPGPREVVGILRGGRITQIFEGTGAAVSADGRLAVLGQIPLLLAAPDAEPVGLELPPGGWLTATFAPSGELVVTDGSRVSVFERDGTLRAERAVSSFAFQWWVTASTIHLGAEALQLSDLAPVSASDVPTLVGEKYVLRLEKVDDQAKTAELNIADRASGRPVARRTIDLPVTTMGFPGQSAGEFLIHFTPDESRAFWISDRMYTLSLPSGQLRSAPLPFKTEFLVGGNVSRDGRHVCIGLSHSTLTLDGRTGQPLSSGPGRYVDCATAGFAVVVDVALAPNEEVVRLERDYSFVMSGHGSRAGFLVSEAGSDALTLIIADYGTSRVLHRIPLPYAHERLGTIRRSDDGEAVVLLFHADQGAVMKRFAFVDGAEQPMVDPDAWRASFPVRPGQAEVAGSTVMFRGERGLHAWDLGASAPVAVVDEGCAGSLSPGGRFLICSGGREEALSILRMADGKRVNLDKPPWCRDCPAVGGKLAVADDGSVALVGQNVLSITDGSRWTRREIVGKPLLEVAWMPDASAVVVRQEMQLHFVPVGEGAGGWSRGIVPSYNQFVDVAPSGAFVRWGDHHLDPKTGAAIDDVGRLELRPADGGERLTAPKDSARSHYSAAQPRAWSPLSRGHLLVTEGIVKLFDRETGDRLATLLPSPRGAVALFDDGRVDSLGEGMFDAPSLVCLRGEKVSPWSDCAAALHDPTALERALGADDCTRQGTRLRER